MGEVELKIFGHSKEERERKPKNAQRNGGLSKNASTAAVNPNNSSMMKNSLLSNSLLGNKENSFAKANKQSRKTRKEDYSPPVQDQGKQRQNAFNSKGSKPRSSEKTQKQKLFPSAINSTKANKQVAAGGGGLDRSTEYYSYQGNAHPAKIHHSDSLNPLKNTFEDKLKQMAGG